MNPAETFEAMVREAAALRRSGRVPEAIAAYRRLLARWPEKPDSWYNLAFLERQAGEFDAALASYQEALNRGASGPEEIHLNRGVILADHLRRDDAAETELNAALALNPNYVPALLNLANLHEDRGRKADAIALYERALALAPNSALALARYANLSRIDSPDHSLVLRLRRAIGAPGVSAADKASLGFALGRLLDGCEAYDAAFAAYQAANRASREAGAGARYDRAGFEALIDEIIKTFGPGTFKPRAAGPSPAIFICGMFRSGSTLAEQVLASHPRVTSGGELPLVPALATEIGPVPINDLGPEIFEDLAGRYRQSVAALFPNADLVTDKRPDNFLYLGLIKLMFPDARIVHTVRDAMDNCLSLYFLHLDHGMAYALDLADTGHYYMQYSRLMAHWRKLFGADIVDFRYDTFVQDPEPSVRRLLAHCGLDWDARCLAFHQADATVKTASVWQVREPLYTRSSGRAARYAAHLGALRAALGYAD